MTPAVAKWEVKIDGDPVDLEYLAALFVRSRLVVTKQPDGLSYRLHHEDFDAFVDVTGSAAVFERASTLAAMLSGMLEYDRGLHRPLTLGAMYAHQADGHVGTIIQLKGAELRVTGGSVVFSVGSVNGAPPVPPKDPKLVQLFELGDHDESVAKAFRLLNAGDASNWGGLYRIYELIVADVGDEKSLVGHGWASDRQLERFRRSANSPSVSGDSARHAKETTQRPPHPMSPNEAKAFVTGLLDAWFQSKGIS